MCLFVVSRETREAGFFHQYAVAVGAKEGAPKVTAHMRSGDAGDPGYVTTDICLNKYFLQVP